MAPAQSKLARIPWRPDRSCPSWSKKRPNSGGGESRRAGRELTVVGGQSHRSVTDSPQIWAFPLVALAWRSRRPGEPVKSTPLLPRSQRATMLRHQPGTDCRSKIRPTSSSATFFHPSGQLGIDVTALKMRSLSSLVIGNILRKSTRSFRA